MLKASHASVFISIPQEIIQFIYIYSDPVNDNKAKKRQKCEPGEMFDCITWWLSYRGRLWKCWICYSIHMKDATSSSPQEKKDLRKMRWWEEDAKTAIVKKWETRINPVIIMTNEPAGESREEKKKSFWSWNGFSEPPLKLPKIPWLMLLNKVRGSV